MASAMVGFRNTFFCFILPTAVLTSIRPPSCSSISTHVGVIWGVPSFIKVDTNTKFLPSKSIFIEGSLILLLLLLLLLLLPRLIHFNTWLKCEINIAQYFSTDLQLEDS